MSSSSTRSPTATGGVEIGGETSQRMVSISYLGLTREEEAARRSSVVVARLVRLLPVGGSPRRRRRQRRSRWRTRRGALTLDRGRAGPVDAAGAGTARRNRLRARSLRLERGTGAAALRTPVRGRPDPRGAGRRGGPRPRPAHDRRPPPDILATAIARLRAKIKYRPVVFELMAPTFTLFQLQRSVEALAGRRLHKQNFRRLIEQQALVEETGAGRHRHRRAAGQALHLPPRRGRRAGRRRLQAPPGGRLMRLLMLAHAETAATRRAIFAAGDGLDARGRAAAAALARPRCDRALTSPAAAARETAAALGLGCHRRGRAARPRRRYLGGQGAGRRRRRGSGGCRGLRRRSGLCRSWRRGRLAR